MNLPFEFLVSGLSLSVDDPTGFPKSVDSYLNHYLERLSCKPISSSLIDKLKVIIKQITSCLTMYYYGDHINAYNAFKYMLDLIDVNGMIVPLPASTLYRGRPHNDKTRLEFKKRENKLFTKNEILHIDFANRYLVRTERYSYPGLPCSYMCSSPNLCCEELKCCDDDLNIAVFKTNESEKIRILDLSYFLRQIDIKDKTITCDPDFVLRWPLIACCSFYYPKDDTDKFGFHPEYIISQFLLQYLIQKSMDDTNIIEEKIEVGYIYGISYVSVRRIDDIESFMRDPFSCICFAFPAFPASISNESGISPSLSQAFELECVYEKSNPPSRLVD